MKSSTAGFRPCCIQDCELVERVSQLPNEELNNAVTETFTNRKTPITMDTAAFSNDFLGDSMHQTRWNSFLKKKKALIPVSMNDAMARIKTFVTPLLIQTDTPVTEWDPNEGCWK